MLAAGVVMVDVVLDDGSPDHGEGGHHESEGDLLDGSEVDAPLSQLRVDDKIHDGDEDDEGDGIKLGYDLRRDALMSHSVGLRGEIVV